MKLTEAGKVRTCKHCGAALAGETKKAAK